MSKVKSVYATARHVAWLGKARACVLSCTVYSTVPGFHRTAPTPRALHVVWHGPPRPRLGMTPSRYHAASTRTPQRNKPCPASRSALTRSPARSPAGSASATPTVAGTNDRIPNEAQSLVYCTGNISYFAFLSAHVSYLIPERIQFCTTAMQKNIVLSELQRENSILWEIVQ